MSRRFKLALIILVVCLSVSLLTYFLDSKILRAKEFKIKIYDYYVTVVLDCPLPKFPKEMQTMEVDIRKPSETDATEFVEKLFNMTPPRLR